MTLWRQQGLISSFSPFTQLVERLETEYETREQGRQEALQLIFSKFHRNKCFWDAAAQATALLDALVSLAQASSSRGYTRPKILDCALDAGPLIRVVQGQHPCIESTYDKEDFVPNDLSLGGHAGRVVLLSGPNMVSSCVGSGDFAQSLSSYPNILSFHYALL